MCKDAGQNMFNLALSAKNSGEVRNKLRIFLVQYYQYMYSVGCVGFQMSFTLYSQNFFRGINLCIVIKAGQIKSTNLQSLFL